MDQQPSPQLPPEQQQPDEEDVPQPVAYDEEGRPLYSAPPSSSYRSQPGPQFVHLSRAISPVKQTVTPELQAKHDESIRAYPALNISEAEFIVSAVRRHPIGLVLPVTMSLLLVVIIASMVINYSLIISVLNIFNPPSFGIIVIIGILLIAILLIIAYTSMWIYRNNQLFLTNESVIQEIQLGLFTHNEQTVSLANIEDASFHQEGIMQMLFDYGSIRLSTEGDESTYQLTYVANPKTQIATLNNAVEAFKNGRPVVND
jgi:uncharacterized membrane protein YdbT with pleckstrin-like domain